LRARLRGGMAGVIMLVTSRVEAYLEYLVQVRQEFKADDPAIATTLSDFRFCSFQY